MRKLSLVLLTLALIAGACSSSSTDGTSAGRPDGTVDLDENDIRLLAGLRPFTDCGDLLSHLQAEARERVGPYGLDYHGGGYWFGGDVAVLEEAAVDDAAFGGDDGGGAEVAADFDTGAAAPQATSEGEAAGGGNDAGFTSTNVQELGVDEPDLIKTDGDRVLVVSEGTLSLVDISGDDPRKTDAIQIPEGWGHELFFQGDRVLLFTNGNGWGYPVPMPAIAEDAEADFAAEVELVEPDYIEPEWYGPSSTIFEIDISDPDDMEIMATMRIQGQYLSARRVADTVRLALTSPPSQLPWVFPSTPAGEDRAERFNRELIDETVIEDWIPEYELTTADGDSERGPLLDCSSLHQPAEFSGFDVVSVLSFDMDDGLDRGAGAGVLASGQTVYASADRFYVATTKWAGEEIIESEDGDAWVEWNDSYTTDIHAFSISPDSPADYVASGMVAGSLLNQFSLDESDGYLRIITTEGSPWSEQNQSQTSLTVFEESGDVLLPVGRVGGIGRGENLYSARLLDDVGFAVTFRQIDPFYVLDLSDPANPTIAGELKLPGVSTYLHPIGTEHVLGVGQDATEEGQILGLKVSLFSVADPNNPEEVANWKLPNANSPVEYDHRAFQFLADDGIAVIPFTTYSGDRDGAVLLQIEGDSIEELGRVTHQPTDQEPTTDCDVVDDVQFPEESELFWIAQEGVRIQVCGSNDNGGYGSWYCDVVPLDDLRYWGPEDEMQEVIDQLTGGRVDPEARIEMCWPDGGNYQLQIQRSFVVGETLWTMSTSQLQANALGDLDVVGVVAL